MYVATRRRTAGSSQWAGISVGHNRNQLAGLIMQYENGWQQRTTDRIFDAHVQRFGSPYRDVSKLKSPEFEYDTFGDRVRSK